jgi:type IV pilus assembly protein PilB
MTPNKLGSILVKQGVISSEKIASALENQRKTNQRLSQILISQGYLKDAQILKALEQHFQLPGIDLNSFQIQPEVTSLIRRDVCEKNIIIPVQKAGANVLVVAFFDPSNIFVKEDLRFITKCRIQAVVATDTAIFAAIEKSFGANVGDILQQVANQAEEDKEEFATVAAADEFIDADDDIETGSAIVKFVNAMLADAVKKKVSDIHFEPYETRFRVRFRQDGNMVEVNSQNSDSAAAISSRIKIMAKLDISERRRPQDGRIKVKLKSGKDMDFRVSVLPTIWGEKIVMRLLDKSNLQLDMTKLGLEKEDLAIFQEGIGLPQGMLLITGPTGSGKTTTIYSALAELNKPDINISTAEDPVEFNLDGINQVQMNPDIDLTFTTALKSFLRQDPDVIMVGEIRDLETAEIAAKAASTGHLVVSTLHTNDAPQTIARLTEMGVPAYVVSSTVNLIVAQRLVGRNCEACKVPVTVIPQMLIDLGVEPAEVGDYKLMKGRGCAICNNTGIKGRIAIFELMRMTEKIKEAILKGASANEIRILARNQGMRTLRRSGLLKLKRGETTIDDVIATSMKDTE